MAISKVILNGETQMDVTGKTVTAGSMLSGVTALKNDGTDITGNIESKTSSDMTVSGATVTAPAGYYASAASKSVASGSAGTPTASKGTVSNHSVSITPSVTNTTGYITGGTKTGTAVTVSASELVNGTKTISASGTTDVTNYESVSVASGSAKTPATTITANPSISVDSSGLITASVSKTQSVTPTVSAGYVASGTAGTITVSGSGTSQLTTQAAQTIHPSTTDQTIASGKYLTGAQTVEAVTTTNLTAENIVSGVTVKVGDSTDDDCVASVTGTASGGGFTATITHTVGGSIRYPYIIVNDEQTGHYANGDTFQFKSGDTFSIRVYGTRGGGSLYINGVTVRSSQGSFTYVWTPPSCDLEIEIKTSGSGSVDITYPVMHITENGTYNVSEYGDAEVNVPGMDFVKGLIDRTLTTITLPSDLTKIGSYAFSYCTNLNLTSLPDSITEIAQYGFYYCKNIALTTLPSAITCINSHVFSNCSMLKLTALPSGVTVISENAFEYCNDLALTTLPSGIIQISGYAFRCCSKLTSISCTGAIAVLSNGAFNGSSSYSMQLAHVSFPNMAVTSLSTAFGSAIAANACQQLEDADIGSTGSIATDAFANCYKLQTLVLRKSDAICTLSNVSAFLNTPMRGYNDLTGTIYVPSALISTYQTATNWSTIYGEGHVTFAAIEGSQYEL